MRNKIVFDTNVILTASGLHENVSEECIAECSKVLLKAMTSSIVVIDDNREILDEYLQKTSPWTGQAVGDKFLKWLINNSANPTNCKQVPLTCGHEPDTYAEFPDQALQADFDPPDRKFVAVSGADRCEPQVVQATDCKWLNWDKRLRDAGVKVQYICPDDICKFYEKKFPGQPLPEFGDG